MTMPQLQEKLRQQQRQSGTSETLVLGSRHRMLQLRLRDQPGHRVATPWPVLLGEVRALTGSTADADDAGEHQEERRWQPAARSSEASLALPEPGSPSPTYLCKWSMKTILSQWCCCTQHYSGGKPGAAKEDGGVTGEWWVIAG